MKNQTSSPVSVEEGNKIIAEFMGAKISEAECFSGTKEVVDYSNCDINPDERGSNRVWLNHVFYHTSWDWLMPVAKKILDYLQNIDRPSINHCCKGDLLEVDIQCAIREIDILNTHKYIVVWIQWHNQQKP